MVQTIIFTFSSTNYQDHEFTQRFFAKIGYAYGRSHVSFGTKHPGICIV